MAHGKESTLEQVSRQDLWPVGNTCQSSLFLKAYPVERTHMEAVLEELQPVGRTHIGEVHEGLSCGRNTTLEPREKHEAEGAAEAKCYEPTLICHLPVPLRRTG